MKRLSWLLILMLVACGPAAVVTPTVTPNPSSTLVTPTATRPPTATIAHQNILKKQCAETLSSFPKDGIPSGTLVLLPSEGLSMLNFRQHTQRIITGHIWSAGTSPNGKWLSYIIYTPAADTVDLITESADGQKQTQLSYEYDWFLYDQIMWLDNERVWFTIWDGKNVNLPTLVLNPFTGDRQLLLPDYPDFNHYFIGPGIPLFYGFNNVVYDPYLRFVVYPYATDNSYTALLNRETGQIVAKINTRGLYGPLPLWLPNGQAVIVSAIPDSVRKNTYQQEWWMIRIDGTIQRLTHFENLNYRAYFGETASLSPDGHYLAFGLYPNEPSNLRNIELEILDLQNLEITSTCLNFSGIPIWSLDSRFIAIEHWDADKKQSSVVVVDFKQGWAFPVFTDDKGTYYKTSPRGWLDTGE